MNSSNFEMTHRTTPWIIHVTHLIQFLLLIVSITKFEIVIGSLHAYLSCNQCVISWVSNITGVRFELFVIGYLWLDTHVIYMSITSTLMAFFAMLHTVCNNFEKRDWQIFLLKRTSQKTFLTENPKFVLDSINQKLNLVSYNSGSNHAHNFKSAPHFALIWFWNYLHDYSLNCAPISPITIITYRNLNLTQSSNANNLFEEQN